MQLAHNQYTLSQSFNEEQENVMQKRLEVTLFALNAVVKLYNYYHIRKKE